MTIFELVTYELDLDILPLDLHVKMQVRMAVRSARRARHRCTDNVKTVALSADAGCKNSLLHINRGTYVLISGWVNS